MTKVAECLCCSEMDMITWNASEGQLETTSSGHRLENTPNRAIVFATKVEMDKDTANPFIFMPWDITELSINLNGHDYTTMIDLDKRQGDVIGNSSKRETKLKNAGLEVYHSLVRSIAPKTGTFAITNLGDLRFGYFLAATDLTRSGRFGTDEIDVTNVKTPAVVAAKTRHSVALPEDLLFHCIFISSGQLAITNKAVSVQLL